MGHLAGNNVTTANNVICIGTPGANVDNSCYIGSIFDVQPAERQRRTRSVNSEGKLGAMSSSRRSKDEVKPMEKASEVIYGHFKPVSFRYKAEIRTDPSVGLWTHCRGRRTDKPRPCDAR